MALQYRRDRSNHVGLSCATPLDEAFAHERVTGPLLVWDAPHFFNRVYAQGEHPYDVHTETVADRSMMRSHVHHNVSVNDYFMWRLRAEPI